MPATTRGLIEPEQIGMLDQVHAMVTGFGDPAPTRLVAAYAALLLLAAVASSVLSRSSRSPATSGSAGAARDENVPFPEPHPA